VEEVGVFGYLEIGVPQPLRGSVIHPAPGEGDHVVGIQPHGDDVAPIRELHDLADRGLLELAFSESLGDGR
jgi:hypothetical protein